MVQRSKSGIHSRSWGRLVVKIPSFLGIFLHPRWLLCDGGMLGGIGVKLQIFFGIFTPIQRKNDPIWRTRIFETTNLLRGSTRTQKLYLQKLVLRSCLGGKSHNMIRPCIRPVDQTIRGWCLGWSIDHSDSRSYQSASHLVDLNFLGMGWKLKSTFFPLRDASCFTRNGGKWRSVGLGIPHFESITVPGKTVFHRRCRIPTFCHSRKGRELVKCQPKKLGVVCVFMFYDFVDFLYYGKSTFGFGKDVVFCLIFYVGIERNLIGTRGSWTFMFAGKARFSLRMKTILVVTGNPGRGFTWRIIYL